MNYDPNRIYNELIEAGNEYADQRAALELHEKMEKPLLAKLRQASNAKTQGERDDYAYGHSEYETWRQQLYERRKDATRAQVRWIAAQELSEHRRTQESTRRAEMRLA